MHYIPCTDEQEEELLSEIGIANFEELVKIIPQNLRVKDKIGVGGCRGSTLDRHATLTRGSYRIRPPCYGPVFKVSHGIDIDIIIDQQAVIDFRAGWESGRRIPWIPWIHIAVSGDGVLHR